MQVFRKRFIKLPLSNRLLVDVRRQQAQQLRAVVTSPFQGSLHLPSLVNGTGADTIRKKYAILVDAENSQTSKLPAILEEIVALDGDAVVRRVYGDFTKSNLVAWRATALALSFLPVNAFSYVSGKGSSDSAMIIEAMELLYTNKSIDGFALVSSDSDFTRLAQRLREEGKQVIGFGQAKTPAPFVTACERFIYTENLHFGPHEQQNDAQSTEQGGVFQHLTKHDKHSGKDAWALLSGLSQLIGGTYEYMGLVSGKKGLVPRDIEVEKQTDGQSSGTRQALPNQLIDKLNGAIDNSCGCDAWARLSRCSEALLALESDFDVRAYGYKKLSQLVRDHPGHFEVRTVNSTVWVRRVSRDKSTP